MKVIFVFVLVNHKDQPNCLIQLPKTLLLFPNVLWLISKDIHRQAGIWFDLYRLVGRGKVTFLGSFGRIYGFSLSCTFCHPLQTQLTTSLLPFSTIRRQREFQYGPFPTADEFQTQIARVSKESESQGCLRLFRSGVRANPLAYDSADCPRRGPRPRAPLNRRTSRRK